MSPFQIRPSRTCSSSSVKWVCDEVGAGRKGNVLPKILGSKWPRSGGRGQELLLLGWPCVPWLEQSSPQSRLTSLYLFLKRPNDPRYMSRKYPMFKASLGTPPKAPLRALVLHLLGTRSPMTFQHLLPRGLCVNSVTSSPRCSSGHQRVPNCTANRASGTNGAEQFEIKQSQLLGNSCPGSQSSKDREVSLQGAQNRMGRAKLHPPKSVGQD